MAEFSISDGDPRLAVLKSLDDTLPQITARAAKPHPFRFVSAGQAKQAEMLIGTWALAGRAGPQPAVDPVSFRAAMYNQGRTAALLAAFHKITCVAAVEFGDAAADGFRNGYLTVPCAALRCLIERIAHAGALADSVRGVSSAPASREFPLKPVLEHAETVMKAVYGTNRDWMKLAQTDLRTTPVKDVAFLVRDDAANLKAPNILNSIDKLEKRIRGSRLAYEVLCEFLHPNIGDLFATSLDNSDVTDRYGIRHLTRVVGLGPKRLDGVPEIKRVVAQMLDIAAEIVAGLPAILDDLEASSKYASRLSRQFAHRMVKMHRSYFDNRDICPCLSGLRVKDCLRAPTR